MSFSTSANCLWLVYKYIKECDQPHQNVIAQIYQRISLQKMHQKIEQKCFQYVSCKGDAVIYLKIPMSREVVAHTFNPSTRETEAGGFLSSRPAWSTKWVPGQPGLHRETLSQKNQKTTTTKTWQKVIEEDTWFGLQASLQACIQTYLHTWIHRILSYHPQSNDEYTYYYIYPILLLIHF
jgi:hypothetical protein